MPETVAHILREMLKKPRDRVNANTSGVGVVNFYRADHLIRKI